MNTLTKIFTAKVAVAITLLLSSCGSVEQSETKEEGTAQLELRNTRRDVAPATSDSIVWGDITGDGQVNVGDLPCTSEAVLAELSGTAYPKCATKLKNADLDCDGKLNIVDLQLVSQRIMACVTGNCNAPLDLAIDANQDGIHNQCETK